MVVEAMRGDDASELLRLARVWEQRPFVVSPGAHGAVVRDGGSVVAVAIMREYPFALVADDVFGEPGERGKRGVAMLWSYFEEFVRRSAANGGRVTHLGVIVKAGDVAHNAALERRGYEILAHIRAKKMDA